MFIFAIIWLWFWGAIITYGMLRIFTGKGQEDMHPLVLLLFSIFWPVYFPIGAIKEWLF